MDKNLEFLKNTRKVFFVAMREELDADSTSSEVVYTGVGKARATRALLKYLQANFEKVRQGDFPMIVSIGTAGSGKHRRGDILLCDRFFNNGDSFIREEISTGVLPEPTGYLCASSDFFVSEHNFAPGDVARMREQFDCMDMESYALANICHNFGIPFCAVKCISDGADDTVANFDAELPRFRATLNAFVKGLE